MTSRAVHLCVRGAVQGVGFRPRLARIAGSHNLRGWVRNTSGGAELWLEGDSHAIEDVIRNGPACIQVIDAREVEPQRYESFRILPSEPGSELGVRVPRDRRACSECLTELRMSGHRHFRDPFTTCASCGPRFTILEALPYDRSRLSLRHFPLCRECVEEYVDPADRRFHVEGIVCPSCGPRVELHRANRRRVSEGDDAIGGAAALLRDGRILAVKGLGGFQLLVRADLSHSVGRLRERKGRATKPFAIMVPGMEWLERHTSLTIPERDWIQSPENPIVLIEASPDRLEIAPEISPGLSTVGVLLPTTPLHHLLLAELSLPVVATSGNRGDEPIAVENDAAFERLANIADAFLTHDRPIVRRADDAVIRVIDAGPVMFRLGRGFAPLPLPALERFPDLPPILAVGGHQKNAVALWTGRQAILGPHIGDLDHADTRHAFEQGIQDLLNLYQTGPVTVACDLHPDYASTAWADASGLPVQRVQHHHAHAAAALVEHDRLDDEVLALTWDGTGFGTDGTIWGGEALLASMSDFQRVASLWPFPLPGGEAAIREPRRSAFGMMAVTLGFEAVTADDALLDRLGITLEEARLFARMIDGGINTPWTSSLGRLFDGAAAIILGAGRVGYESEGAQRLESAAANIDGDGIEIPLGLPAATDTFVGDRSIPRGDWRPLLRSLWKGFMESEPAARLAASFHASVARWGLDIARLGAGRPVSLCGGCFQNRRLREGLARQLRESGYAILAASRIPPGDGGLAVGQLAVAMYRQMTRR